MLSPVFNQVVWIDFDGRHSLGTWREIGGLLGLAALLDLAILSENPLFIYPLSVLSGVSRPGDPDRGIYYHLGTFLSTRKQVS